MMLRTAACRQPSVRRCDAVSGQPADGAVAGLDDGPEGTELGGRRVQQRRHGGQQRVSLLRPAGRRRLRRSQDAELTAAAKTCPSRLHGLISLSKYNEQTDCAMSSRNAPFIITLHERLLRE